jgi:hypothetical protein
MCIKLGHGLRHHGVPRLAALLVDGITIQIKDIFH